MRADRSRDLARTTFQLLALGALIATSFWIVRPFLVALVWATMIVVATWPLLLYAQKWLGGRRSLAVASMTIALLLVLLVPLYFGIEAIVVNARQVAEWSRSLATFEVPRPPQWIETLPVVGAKAAARWRELAVKGPDDFAARLAPHVNTILLWLVSQMGSIGSLVVQFLLTVIIAGILYARGESAAHAADRFARRLAGPRGVNSMHLAKFAIRGVALGVVVTAALQAGLAGIGMAIAGVPFVTFLTVLIFILAIAQIGAVPVLLLAVIWVYSQSGVAWGTVFLIWAIFCGTFDNFLRPMLIKRGADLPLLLIFAGVVGGLIAFGVIGLFIGPVVLAVAYTLLADWVSEGDAPDDPAASATALPDGGGRPS
jgi:predicted PurR-regulated permease PerM